MKVTLKPAKFYQVKTVIAQQKRQATLHEIVAKFINEKVQPSIENATKNAVNVEVPSEAYGQLRAFYSECDKVLKPLGYTSCESHDGGGMYNTLFVKW